MEEEKYFNINTMLKNLFQSLDQSCKTKKPNLVFIFSKTVPCEMKGDVSTLYIVLLKTLQGIIQNECSNEIVVSIDAPEEFLYKEPVTFKITNIPMKQEVIMPKFRKILSDDLTKLDASFDFTEENGGSIVITLPLTTAELGCRRHYRLPSKSILDKNILLVVKGNNLALGLTKMFKYFPMNVDLCINKFKDKYDLSRYDLVVVEDRLLDFHLYALLETAVKKSDVKFVLFGNSDIYNDDDTSKLHIDFLEKPVTQESVYRLLLSLFDELPILT